MASKRRVITDLDLHFLSGVDRPAQEGATSRTIKNDKGAAMAATKTAEQYEAEMAELNKRLQRAEALAGMSDAEKAFMRGLDPDDRPAFVGKSATERAAVMKKAEDDDPEVYKSQRTGKSYRKSQQDLADMAKRLDEAEEQKEEIAKTARTERIAKRVSELPNLSDDEGGLTALVDAVDKMADAKVKKAATAILDAINEQAGSFQRPHGVRKGGNEATDVAKAKQDFDNVLAEYAKRHNLSTTEAHVHAIEHNDPAVKKAQKAWRAAQKAAN